MSAGFFLAVGDGPGLLGHPVKDEQLVMPLESTDPSPNQCGTFKTFTGSMQGIFFG